MLLDAGLAGDRKIVVLQPRRVAARTVAARVAWERKCPLGGEVGYQIRFDDQTSLGTRISYVTEGILLRWLQDDRTLSNVGVVLFDEFHERNLLSDVALALVQAPAANRAARPEDGRHVRHAGGGAGGGVFRRGRGDRRDARSCVLKGRASRWKCVT